MKTETEIKKDLPIPADPFLEAWKEAVTVIGPKFFGPGTLQTATNKNHLRPDYKEINRVIRVFSGGERRFVVGAISFYNSTWAVELAKSVGEGPTLCDVTCHLNRDWVAILFRLAIHYRGW